MRSCAWTDREPLGDLGSIIMGQMSTGDVVEVCWGLPGQGKPFSDCFTSTCPGPCERLKPPLDGREGDTAGHKSTGIDPYSKEDHVRNEKAWGSKQWSVCLFRAQTSKEQQVSGI